MIARIATALVLLMAGIMPAAAQTAQSARLSEKEATTLNLTAYAELLRSDVRVQKVAILTELMGFTEAEDAAFWPIYREYDTEMAKHGDERVALIAEYAANYSNLTDAVAEKLATKALELEAGKQATKARVLPSASRKRYRRGPHCASCRSSTSWCYSRICRSRPHFRSSSSQKEKCDEDVNCSMDCGAARLSPLVCRCRLTGSGCGPEKSSRGMFLGGDSKTVRVLLDSGQVSEVPLEDAVAHRIQRPQAGCSRNDADCCPEGKGRRRRSR